MDGPFGHNFVFELLLMSTWIHFFISIKGFIKHEHDGPDGGQHPFHVPRFAAFAEPGAIFDSTSTWRPYIPVLLHVILTLTMNMSYSKVAEILTKWESKSWNGRFVVLLCS